MRQSMAASKSRRLAKAAEAPSQEAQHVVAGTGIDHEQLVVRRNHQTAVALPDVDEHELEQTFPLQTVPRVMKPSQPRACTGMKACL